MVIADKICSHTDAAGVCYCECITPQPQEIYTAVNLMKMTPISSLYSGRFVLCETLERYIYFRVKCRATGLERLCFPFAALYVSKRRAAANKETTTTTRTVAETKPKTETKEKEKRRQQRKQQ